MVNDQKFINIHNDKDEKLHDKSEIRKKKIKYHTLLRIISPFQLKYNFKPKNTSATTERTINYFGLSFNVATAVEEELKNVNLIIHIHGGGFFATTTESHLGYLIK